MSNLQIKNNSAQTDPIYFYRRDDPYFEFSNFSAHGVTTTTGIFYSTVEHLLQASKFLTGSSRPDLARTIQSLPFPGAALKLATANRSFQRSDWFSVNTDIMSEALYLKFTQHKVLGNLLESTGERELKEDSPVDYFWGIGKKGDGRNELGKALMKLRETLRAEKRVRELEEAKSFQKKEQEISTDVVSERMSGALNENEWPALGQSSLT